MPFSEAEARVWCEALASGLKAEHIKRDGKPYLVRYYAAGWNPVNRVKGPALFLHHFLSSDSADVHSHPWGWSSSLIMAGGYREIRCDGHGSATTREYRPGEVNIIGPNDKHRVELLGADCWTLFMAGNFQQPWGFAPHC